MSRLTMSHPTITSHLNLEGFCVFSVECVLVVCGTRSSMLAGLSCTKGVWYIYDWDTGSTILIW